MSSTAKRIYTVPTEDLSVAKYSRSEQISDLVTALAIAQGVIEGAVKDSANPFFKSSYADLASVWTAIRKPLSENGLAVLQLPTATGAEVTITTILAHTSGQWISSDLTVTAKEDTPQAIGSAITYARRYALQSVAGVAPEDDDGERAQGRTGAPVRQMGGADHRRAATHAAPASTPRSAPDPNVPAELVKVFERIEKDPSQFVQAAKMMEDACVDALGQEAGLKAYDEVADAFYSAHPNGTQDIRELKAVLLALHKIVATAPARA